MGACQKKPIVILEDEIQLPPAGNQIVRPQQNSNYKRQIYTAEELRITQKRTSQIIIQPAISINRNNIKEPLRVVSQNQTLQNP